MEEKHLVDNSREFEALRRAYEIRTSTSFVAARTHKSMGTLAIDTIGKNFKLQWPDSDEEDIKHPYMAMRRERYECHHGPDRNVSKKSANLQEANGRGKTSVQGTKKMGCTAYISVKEIVLFTDYDASQIPEWKRRFVSKEVKNDQGQLSKQQKLLVVFPALSDHRYHLLGMAEEICLPIDERVRAKAEELVRGGFLSSHIIRSLLEYFVKKELFSEKTCPSATNRRFFPTQRDVSNIIYATKMKMVKSKYDQENLISLLEEWQQELPEDHFHFEPLSEESGFIFVYQSEWQRHLMDRYGAELCFLDATYRVTKYALPLFFVAVKTNVDYAVVGLFCTQYENSYCIADGLKILKKWNPNWKPSYFMVDHCEAEMMAISRQFPGSAVLICDFHREQAWIRWLRAGKHGLAGSAEQVLPLLRAIATAKEEEALDAALKNLKASDYWKYKPFREWFDNTWLNHVQKWASFYRRKRLNININTNNGIERQNKTLKYEFLAHYTDRSLTGMLKTVIFRFLPDMQKRYVEMNVKSTSYYRQYRSSLPDFLHNRPKAFAEHCAKRLVSNVKLGTINEYQPGCFECQSFTNHDTTYRVEIGDNISCQCMDWQRTYWPCKHILAILMHHREYCWEDLPKWYRDNPLFTLDHICLMNVGATNDQLCDIRVDASVVKEEVKVKLEISTDEPMVSTKVEADKAKKDIEAKAIELRELAEELKAASYLPLSLDVLISVTEKTKEIRQQLYSSLESEDKIAHLGKLSVRNMSELPFGISKSKKAKRSIDEKQFKDLPMPKKKKKKEQNKSKGKEHMKVSSVEDKEKKNDKAEHKFIQDVSNITTEVNVPDSLTVGNITFRTEDLSTCDASEWLNDKIVHAYLALLAKEGNGTLRTTIYSFSCFLATLWDQKLYQRWIFNKVNLTMYTHIFMPICKDNHWTLFVANIRERTIAILDPLQQNSWPVAKQYLKHWIEFLKARSSHLSETVDQWKVVNYDHAQQIDGSSCGVFILMYAEQIARGFVPKILKQCHVDKYRQTIKSRLINNAREMNDAELCELPFCNRPQGTLLDWIQCDSCDRWIHCICGETNKDVDTYICLICVAMGY